MVNRGETVDAGDESRKLIRNNNLPLLFQYPHNFRVRVLWDGWFLTLIRLTAESGWTGFSQKN
jgi:hypothetical protein